MNKNMKFICAAAGVFGLTSLANADGPTHAIAVMGGASGSSVSGVIHFETTPQGLHITGELKGLKPTGKHGFHIHEFGDCSAPDGTSAGGHFKMPNTMHGSMTSPMRHLGDLGNIVSDEAGSAKYDYTDPHLSLSGADSILGRSVIVHGGEDDLKTDPAGNAGPRVGCGVVGLAK